VGNGTGVTVASGTGVLVGSAKGTRVLVGSAKGTGVLVGATKGTGGSVGSGGSSSTHRQVSRSKTRSAAQPFTQDPRHSISPAFSHG
jgi:hypothetical protein